MNTIQSLIDRQLGIISRFGYDDVLRRLVVREEESFHGLGAAGAEDPPIFACRFAESRGREHILALANEDGRVAIQDTSKINSESLLEGFQCHNNAVFDLAWMPGHMNFVTVSGDHTACLWDVAEGSPKRVLVFSNHTRSVKTAVFRPTEPSVFATGARDGNILIWDIRANNQPALVLKPDNQLMNCHSSFTPKTPGSHSKRPRIDTQRAISITGLVFQDDQTLISCGECDGNIKVWDMRKNYSGYTREPLPKHSIPYCGSSTKNGYTNLIVDSARVRLYASCMDNVIYCFNVSTYSALPERRYVGHENSTFYIKTCLSPDSRYLVSGSSDKHAYIWSVRCSQPLVRLAGHRAEVTCAAWAAGPAARLVTCSDDARHMIWRVGREDEQEPLSGRAEPAPRAEPSAEGRWGLATPGDSRRRKLAAAPESGAKRARLAPDGSARKTKRCLAELLSAAREADETPACKRARPAEPPLQPAGGKRPHCESDEACSPGERACRLPCEPGWDTARATQVTPPKKYSCDSTRSPRAAITERTPEKSPGARVRAFTAELPDWVRDGAAPHLRLMSPVKRRAGPADWLTRLARDKRPRLDCEGPLRPRLDCEGPLRPRLDCEGPLRPLDNLPARRTSTSDKTPRPTEKTGTLHKYFSVAKKEKV